MDIKSMTLEELQEYFISLGEKSFRAKQVYQWMHEKLASGYDEMSNLSKDLREKLQKQGEYTKLNMVQVQESAIDGTRKYLFELPDDTAGKVLVLAKKLATQMKETLDCDGLNLVQNNGKEAGQTVNHFHMHLIPRYLNDGQKICWKPGEPTQDELESIKNQMIG